MKEKINYYLLFSEKTKRDGSFQYEKTIADYLLLYFNNVSADDFDLKMLNNFIIYLKSKTDLRNVSINKCIKLLRSVFKLHGLNLTWLNDYSLLKENKGRFDMLSDAELRLIFNYIDNSLKKTKGNAHHYRIMVYLLYDTGIRQSELLNIKRSDVNLVERCILIQARKSNTDRYVFLSDRMTSMMGSHLSKLPKHELLFYNFLRERPFSRNDLKLFYRRVKKATGIDKLHSHMFRHTYATDLIELNVPLFVVQKQLGHASIKTTEIYYHSSLKFQKEEMFKISSQR